MDLARNQSSLANLRSCKFHQVGNYFIFWAQIPHLVLVEVEQLPNSKALPEPQWVQGTPTGADLFCMGLLETLLDPDNQLLPWSLSPCQGQGGVNMSSYVQVLERLNYVLFFLESITDHVDFFINRNERVYPVRCYRVCSAGYAVKKPRTPLLFPCTQLSRSFQPSKLTEKHPRPPSQDFKLEEAHSSRGSG